METKAKVVFFSEGLADFLKHMGALGYTPVVITSPDATMTFAARYVLETAGAIWINRLENGFLDTRNGCVITRIASLADSASTGHITSTSDVEEPAYLQAVFGVTVHYPAADNTKLGGALDSLATSLTGWGPSGWGLYEPAALAWNPDEYTETARRLMPESRFVVSGGGSTSFQAMTLVRRTTKGVEETISGGAIIGMTSSDNSEIITRLPNMLVELADALPMPVIGTIGVRAGGRSLSANARASNASFPVAGLIGPRAVRDLGIDIDDFSRRFPVITAGRKRLPSIVVPFTGPGQGSWAQMRDVLEALGGENIRHALGFPPMPSVGGAR